MAKAVLAIGAHPDDIEFFMGGTFLLLGDAGYELHYLTIANGSCGSMTHDAATIARIRREEAMAAARSAGAVFHESLVEDLAIFHEPRLIARVAAVVREAAPEIVLAHAPSDYMEDHMNACRLAVTATFVRAIPNFRTDPPRPPVQQDATLYHAQPHGNRDYLGRLVQPDFLIDVGDVLDRKTAMLSRHKSQKDWLDATQGLGSYLHVMRELTAEMGALSGRFAHAEGWRRHNPIGFCAPGADPLCRALAARVVEAGAAERPR